MDRRYLMAHDDVLPKVISSRRRRRLSLLVSVWFRYPHGSSQVDFTSSTLVLYPESIILHTLCFSVLLLKPV